MQNMPFISKYITHVLLVKIFRLSLLQLHNNCKYYVSIETSLIVATYFFCFVYKCLFVCIFISVCLVIALKKNVRVIC